MTTLETTYGAGTTPFLSHRAEMNFERSPLVEWPLQENETAFLRREDQVFRLPVEEKIRARAVPDEVAPSVWVNDEPEAEDLFPIPKVIHATGHVVSRGKLPVVDFDDDPLCEDEVSFPPLQARTVMARVVHRGRLPHGLEPDEDGDAE